MRGGAQQRHRFFPVNRAIPRPKVLIALTFVVVHVRGANQVFQCLEGVEGENVSEKMAEAYRKLEM